MSLLLMDGIETVPGGVKDEEGRELPPPPPPPPPQEERRRRAAREKEPKRRVTGVPPIPRLLSGYPSQEIPKTVRSSSFGGEAVFADGRSPSGEEDGSRRKVQEKIFRNMLRAIVWAFCFRPWGE